MNLPSHELVALIEVALERGARVRFRATGGSMVPFLRHHDVVELERVSHSQYRPGDIVLAQRSDGGYVLHRIVRLAEGRGLVASDGGQTDGWIPFDNMVARARAVQRRGRWLRLDTPLARHAGLLWARIRFVGWPLLRLALKVRRRILRPQTVPAGCDESPP